MKKNSSPTTLILLYGVGPELVQTSTSTNLNHIDEPISVIRENVLDELLLQVMSLDSLFL